jgi:26S proteasome regulatory subunit N5
VFSKKHGQLKEAVVKMVDAGLEIVVALKSGEGKVERSYATEDGKGDRWLDLIDCLRDITEGKVSSL